MKTLGNIIWVVFGGLHIALEYFIAGLVLMITIIGIPFGLQSLKLVCGLIFCITIIGIPFGKMHFRLAKLALSPFGKEVV